jgi:hypothetical protein
MMKTIVLRLNGVPVAVSFLFVVFTVDAEKLSPRFEISEVNGKMLIARDGTTSVAAPHPLSQDNVCANSIWE